MEYIKDNVVTVFWSGGMDSTFMVLDFLRRGYKVQPYYINKFSTYTGKEIDSIKHLTYLIQKEFNYGKNFSYNSCL